MKYEIFSNICDEKLRWTFLNRADEIRYSFFDKWEIEKWTNYWNDSNLVGGAVFVAEFDFGEADRFAHPVGPEVGRVRVQVGGGHRRTLLLLRARFPSAVDVLPSLLVRGHEIKHHWVHGVRVQAIHSHFDHGKHSSKQRNGIPNGSSTFSGKS